MDPAANPESPMILNHQSECEVAAVVGHKRPLEEFVARSAKKVNIGSRETPRVAENVLVLSTMAGMRGGRNPTETGLNLMMELRAKLVGICQDLAPEDLVVKDAIGTLVEDLGLNCKLRDQRLGYRGSRLTIKDKFSLAKMKIEESKKYSATPTYTSQTQPSFGSNTENHGPSHSIRMYQSDKPSNPSLTSGGLRSSAQVHAPAANSTSVTPHLFNTDARNSTISTGTAHSRLITGSGVDKTHIQSTTTNLSSVHQPMQGAKYVQTSSLFNNHNEIAKIVRKLLQPELPRHPTWTPPSREYMYKPLACQMCHAVMNEVESVVVCDACEKGYHLKCLETINQNGIPRGGEWHCIQCTTLSNGEPLPPKYGRVMRSATQMKGDRSIPDDSKSLDSVSDSPVVLSSESSSQPPEVSESLMKEDKPVSESNLQTPISLETVNEKMENFKPSENADDLDQTELSNYCEVETNPGNNKGEGIDNKKEHSDLATSSDVRQGG